MDSKEVRSNTNLNPIRVRGILLFKVIKTVYALFRFEICDQEKFNIESIKWLDNLVYFLLMHSLKQ